VGDERHGWVTNATAAALSIITGGGKWVEIFTSGEAPHYAWVTAGPF
jgi:hypothetical protein